MIVYFENVGTWTDTPTELYTYRAWSYIIATGTTFVQLRTVWKRYEICQLWNGMAKLLTELHMDEEDGRNMSETKNRGISCFIYCVVIFAVGLINISFIVSQKEIIQLGYRDWLAAVIDIFMIASTTLNYICGTLWVSYMIQTYNLILMKCNDRVKSLNSKWESQLVLSSQKNIIYENKLKRIYLFAYDAGEGIRGLNSLYAPNLLLDIVFAFTQLLFMLFYTRIILLQTSIVDLATHLILFLLGPLTFFKLCLEAGNVEMNCKHFAYTLGSPSTRMDALSWDFKMRVRKVDYRIEYFLIFLVFLDACCF